VATIPKRLMIPVLAVLLVISGCSGDEAVDAASTTVVAGAEPETDDGTGTGGTPADLTGREICDTLTADTVSAALAVTVDSAEPVEDGTPQCSYSYTTDDGVLATATVAVQRSEDDLGGRSGTEAYEYVLELNRDLASGDLASGSEITETPINVAGQGAVLSPPDTDGLHFGVVEVGGRVITTIVSASAGDSIDAIGFTEIAAGILTP